MKDKPPEQEHKKITVLRNNNIIVAADHAGWKLKEELKPFLKKFGNVVDVGNTIYDENDDYPDFAAAACRTLRNKGGTAFLFCGSAEGMCIAANKMKGIRAVVGNTKEGVASGRMHNDANVLCLAGGATKDAKTAQTISLGKIQDMIRVWLTTEFSGAKRHMRRIAKVMRLEQEK